MWPEEEESDSDSTSDWDPSMADKASSVSSRDSNTSERGSSDSSPRLLSSPLAQSPSPTFASLQRTALAESQRGSTEQPTKPPQNNSLTPDLETSNSSPSTTCSSTSDIFSPTEPHGSNTHSFSGSSDNAPSAGSSARRTRPLATFRMHPPPGYKHEDGSKRGDDDQITCSKTNSNTADKHSMTEDKDNHRMPTVGVVAAAGVESALQAGDGVHTRARTTAANAAEAVMSTTAARGPKKAIASGGGSPNAALYSRTHNDSTEPPYSYQALIYNAIHAIGKERVHLEEIYCQIMASWAYYAARPHDPQRETGWKHSIRHSLSVSRCFKKEARPKGKSGKEVNYWAIDEALAKIDIQFDPIDVLPLVPVEHSDRYRATAGVQLQEQHPQQQQTANNESVGEKKSKLQALADEREKPVSYTSPPKVSQSTAASPATLEAAAAASVSLYSDRYLVDEGPAPGKSTQLCDSSHSKVASTNSAGSNNEQHSPSYALLHREAGLASASDHSLGGVIGELTECVGRLESARTMLLKLASELPVAAVREAIVAQKETRRFSSSGSNTSSSALMPDGVNVLAETILIDQFSESIQQQIKYVGTPRIQSLAAKVSGRPTSNALHTLKMPPDFSSVLEEDFQTMFNDGERINGNTRQIVVPDPDAKLHSDARLSYAHFNSLNAPFRNRVEDLLTDNIDELRNIAASESGSDPSRMVISMAAILLSNGTAGQGPHVDQYKSRQAVQLIVYLSKGPGTRVFQTPPQNVVETASNALGIDMAHCRTASSCGALLLEREHLDVYKVEPQDVNPGDVMVIPGNQVHSAPPSTGKRAVLFLMFDHKDEFTHYSHQLQLNRLGCLMDCWLEMSPGLDHSKWMSASKPISEALCKIASDEKHEAPWSILANSDFHEIRKIAFVLEKFANSNGGGRWVRESVVLRVQKYLCALTSAESSPSTATAVEKLAQKKKKLSTVSRSKVLAKIKTEGGGAGDGNGSTVKRKRPISDLEATTALGRKSLRRNGQSGPSASGSHKSKPKSLPASKAPTICNICDQTFSSARNLNRHVESKHREWNGKKVAAAKARQELHATCGATNKALAAKTAAAAVSPRKKKKRIQIEQNTAANSESDAESVMSAWSSCEQFACEHCEFSHESKETVLKHENSCSRKRAASDVVPRRKSLRKVECKIDQCHEEAIIRSKGVCIAHENDICLVPECATVVTSTGSAFCKVHNNSGLCLVANCKKPAVAGRFCRMHKRAKVRAFARTIKGSNTGAGASQHVPERPKTAKTACSERGCAIRIDRKYMQCEKHRVADAADRVSTRVQVMQFMESFYSKTPDDEHSKVFVSDVMGRMTHGNLGNGNRTQLSKLDRATVIATLQDLGYTFNSNIRDQGGRSQGGNKYGRGKRGCITGVRALTFQEMQSSFCSVQNCTTAAQTQGLCNRHAANEFCAAPNCESLAIKSGLCKKHIDCKICSALDCTDVANLRGRCNKHRDNGICYARNCSEVAVIGGVCIRHGIHGLCSTPSCFVALSTADIARSSRRLCFGCSIHPSIIICNVRRCGSEARRSGFCLEHAGAGSNIIKGKKRGQHD